jgi:hypothetical protein
MRLIPTLILTVALVGACERAETPGAARTAPAAGGSDASSRSFSSVLSHFEMAIPDRWEQRYTASERTEPDEYPGASSVVEFVFLPATGGEPPSLLTIIRYPRATWARIKGASPPVGQLLEEKGTNTFVAALPPSNPYPAGSEDGSAYDRMRVTLAQVKAGFRGR